jgi:hypothetical protein
MRTKIVVWNFVLFIFEIPSENQNLPLDTKHLYDEIKPTQLSCLRVPALAVIAVINQIGAVWTENTWHATRAASGSVSKAITKDSINGGDGGVLVAHFVVCVVESVLCVVFGWWGWI